jgi:hypothetical protein
MPLDGRISRAVVVPPGQYDLYVGLADRPDPQRPSLPLALVFRQPIDVPSFGPALAVSSIVLAQRASADPEPQRPDFERQLDEPYALWGSKVVPALDSTFRRADTLTVMFLVYNAAAGRLGKPDVVVEYDFYQVSGGAEAFFSRTRPETIDATTLAPAFDLAAGDLVTAGRQVPLAAFPDGDYRLRITVVDRTNGSRVTADVSFAVAGS